MKIQVKHIPNHDKPIWYFDNSNRVISVWNWETIETILNKGARI